MSNQLQIESYRISMRKLRTFYRKVTEFLNDDKITCLHRLGVIAKIELYRRAEQTVYLCNWIGCLCKSQTGVVYIYFGFIRYLEWCKQGFYLNTHTKTLKTPYIFSEPTACLKFRQSLKRASSLRLYLNFKHWHDVPIGKYIQR